MSLTVKVRPRLVGLLLWVLVSYGINDLYLAGDVAAHFTASLPAELFSTIYPLGLAVLIVVAVYGLANHKSYGRWLGVVCFVLDAPGITHSAYFLYDLVEDSNVSVLVAVVWGVLDLLAAAYLTFSPQVNYYFREGDGPVFDPDPGPTFEEIVEDVFDN